MDEMDYYRALGIEPPADEGANEQEVAEPAQEATETIDEAADAVTEDGADDDAAETEPVEEGAKEQEVAEPAGDKTVQAKEERARQAAGRRARERAEAEEQARQAERESIDARLKEVFAFAGFKDGDTPIETLEQMEAYLEKARSAQLERELKAGKLTPEMLRQTVAEEVARQAPQPQESAEPPEAFRQQVEAEIAEIRKYDPSIRSVDDLRSLDRWDAFFKEVSEHEHSFIDAYRYVYADKIAEQKAAAAAQRARNAERSKAHLQPVGARGAGDAPVPAAVRDMYRSIDPNMTDEQIRKDYQRYEKTKRN